MGDAELAVGAGCRELVPGYPDEIDRLAGSLGRFASRLLDAAASLRLLDSGSWSGSAGDAFRDLLSDEPRTFERAGLAFEEAAGAAARWAVASREAQSTALRAVLMFEAADDETRRWERSRQTLTTDLAVMGDAEDPGEEGRRTARRLLAETRESLAQTAAVVRRALEAAEDGAPDKPGFFDKLGGGIADFAGGVWDGASDVAGSVAGAVKGIVTDPGGFLNDAWDNLYDSVAVWNWDTFTSTWIAFGKEFVAWDEWAKNPLRALGRVTFNIALTIGTVGIAKVVQKLIGKRKGGRSPPEEALLQPPALSQLAEQVQRMSPAESWPNPGSRARHFRDHGSDFDISNADDYARLASDFLHRAITQKLPSKVDADGVIRVFDPSSCRTPLARTTPTGPRERSSNRPVRATSIVSQGVRHGRRELHVPGVRLPRTPRATAFSSYRSRVI